MYDSQGVVQLTTAGSETVKRALCPATDCQIALKEQHSQSSTVTEASICPKDRGFGSMVEDFFLPIRLRGVGSIGEIRAVSLSQNIILSISVMKTQLVTTIST